MSKFEESVYGALPAGYDEANEDKFTTSTGLTISKSYAKTNVNTDTNIFDSAWLNSGLSEARRLRRLRRVEREVSEALVDDFRDQLDSSTKQQALFSLLGFGYVQNHFPHHKWDPAQLNKMETRARERALEEMKMFVNDKVRLALDNYREKHGADKKLAADVREIFVSDMNAEITKRLVKDGKLKIKNARKQGHKPKVVELEDTMPDRIRFLEVTLKDFLFNCPETNDLVLTELTGRVLILPPVFRQQLFDKLYLSDVIGDEERAQQKAAYAERVRAVMRQNRLANVSDWPGRRAVDAAVILAYERSPALKEELEVDMGATSTRLDLTESTDDRLVFYTRILCLAKLLGGDDSYSPTHLFWLVRAVKYFPELRESDNTKEDKAVHCGYHFEKFSLQIPVASARQVFVLAQMVSDTLESEESSLLGWLQKAVGKGLDKVDPTLFSQSVIAEDHVKGKDVLKRFLKKKRLAEEDQVMFGDFRILLRKWISEAFVGCMSRNGASLVWDFLFIHRFSRTMTCNVCLTLFHLLKPLLETADSFVKVFSVMTEGPKVLLIRDLRRVLQHFAKGGAYATIPGAPFVPRIEFTPPSARTERQALDRRIEALNMDFVSE